MRVPSSASTRWPADAVGAVSWPEIRPSASAVSVPASVSPTLTRTLFPAVNPAPVTTSLPLIATALSTGALSLTVTDGASREIGWSLITPAGGSTQDRPTLKPTTTVPVRSAGRAVKPLATPSPPAWTQVNTFSLTTTATFCGAPPTPMYPVRS